MKLMNVTMEWLKSNLAQLVELRDLSKDNEFIKQQLQDRIDDHIEEIARRERKDRVAECSRKVKEYFQQKLGKDACPEISLSDRVKELEDSFRWKKWPEESPKRKDNLYLVAYDTDSKYREWKYMHAGFYGNRWYYYDDESKDITDVVRYFIEIKPHPKKLVKKGFKNGDQS